MSQTHPKRWVSMGLSLTGLLLGALVPAAPALAEERRDPTSLSIKTDVGKPLEDGLPTRNASRSFMSGVYYDDPANDAGMALDVEGVGVRNVQGGYIYLDIYSDQEFIDPYDLILMFLDTDANRVTGDLGADYLIYIDGDGWDSNGDGLGDSPMYGLGRWMGSGYNLDTPQASLSISQEGEWIYTTISTSELSGTQGFNFEIVTLWPDDPNYQPDIDFAPDEGFWSYQFDVEPPQVETYGTNCPAPCAVGTEIPLSFRYTVYDDVVSELIQIYSSTSFAPIDEITTEFAPNDPDTTWSINWPVPQTPRGWHRYCVTPTDLAGNTGSASCSKITFPRVRTDARLTWTQFSDHVVLDSLRLSGLPTNSKIEIRCTRKCSLRERATASGRFSSARFTGKSFPKGTVIEVRATHPRMVGYYEKLTVVLGYKGIEQVDRCMAPGTNAPSRRCS